MHIAIVGGGLTGMSAADELAQRGVTLKPPFQTPVANLWLSCMAQVYPEDRGMNYAIVFGQKAAQAMLALI